MSVSAFNVARPGRSRAGARLGRSGSFHGRRLDEHGPDPKAQVRVHIRWMIRRDMPEVLAIEHASFEFPWCEEEFLRVLRQRNCIGMVAEHGERVVGFMIYELHKNRLHVLDFAVHPEFRRQGVGRQMVAQARRQALQPPPDPDRPARPRDQPGRPALLPRRRASAPWRSSASTSRTPARTPT